MSDISDIEVAKLFPEFEVLSKIATSGEGIVFHIKKVSDGVELALKVLIDDSEDAIFRFVKEAQLMNKFEHPNVAKVYDYGERGGRHFLTMEYISGGDLLGVIARQEISDEEAGNLVYCIAHALNYVHSEGVLHRDIKPANVMMTTNGDPKLIDFGLAYCAGEDLSKLDAVGSEGYAAPEIWDNPDRISIQSDIYALGALLYTVLTRVFPDAHRVNYNKLFNRDQSYVGFIFKAMSKDASKRHSCAYTFAEELANLVGNLGKANTMF